MQTQEKEKLGEKTFMRGKGVGPLFAKKGTKEIGGGYWDIRSGKREGGRKQGGKNLAREEKTPATNGKRRRLCVRKENYRREKTTTNKKGGNILRWQNNTAVVGGRKVGWLPQVREKALCNGIFERWEKRVSSQLSRN